MRKTLLCAFAAMLLAAPAGHAHPTYHYRAHCDAVVTQDGTDPGEWVGVAYFVAEATHADGAPAPDVSVTGTCSILVNGIVVGDVAHSRVDIVDFEAAPGWVLTTCVDVWVGGQHHTGCGQPPSVLPVSTTVPEWVKNLVERTLDSLDAVECDFVAAQDGGPLDQPPLWDLRSDGDIYLAGEFLSDCPPYGTSGS